MIRNPKQSARIGLMLSISIALSLTCCQSALGQGKGEGIPWALDGQTMAVAWADPNVVDLDMIDQMIIAIGGKPNSGSDQSMKQPIRSLKKANANGIYVVIDYSSLMGQPPLVVITSKDTEATANWLKSEVPSHLPMSVVVMNNAVVFGTKDRIDRLKEGQSSETSEKLAALCRESKSDHGFAIAVPKVPRDMLVNLLRSQPNPPEFAGQPLSQDILQGFESAAIQFSETNKQFTAKVEFEKIDHAQKAASIVKSLIESEPETNPVWNPKQSERSLQWNIQGMEACIQAVKGFPLIRKAREEAKAMQTMNNLKQVALAFHNFESAYQKLPPQALTSNDGKKLLSWRVLILPFIEQNELYNKFKLDEPWDSPHNLALVKEMPAIYASAGAEPGKATVQTPLTPKSAFGRPGKPVTLLDVLDGTSGTVWLIDSDPADAVIWTKPEDYDATTENAFSRLFQNRKKIPIGFIDGSIRTIEKSLSFDTFNKLLTIADGELVELP